MAAPVGTDIESNNILESQDLYNLGFLVYPWPRLPPP